MKRIIVSAANDGYYPLLIDLISSIEDGKGRSDVAIGVLDVGLTGAQRDALSARVQHLVTPNWDYQFSASSSTPQKFRAMTARPHLPKHFPGYDIIMWMDADAWVQQWSAVEYFFDQAVSRGAGLGAPTGVHGLSGRRRDQLERAGRIRLSVDMVGN